jgi:hypothetical protein
MTGLHFPTAPPVGGSCLMVPITLISAIDDHGPRPPASVSAVNRTAFAVTALSNVTGLSVWSLTQVPVATGTPKSIPSAET